MTITIPHSDIDLYCDESILDPYDGYRTLRDSGPAVLLDRYDVYAVARYRDVYDALRDHETFISGAGVAMNDLVNDQMHATISSDPPLHSRIRRLTGKPLTPKALSPHHQSIQERADELVDQLIERGTFDACTDFAEAFPLSVVPDLVGWPAEGRENFLAWGFAQLDALGPLNERMLAAVPAVLEMLEYQGRMSTAAGGLKADGWAARLLEEAEADGISQEMLPAILGDFLTPALDATVRALATALWLFGNHQDQWKIMREDPSLVPSAFNEVLRIETPFSGFTRQVSRDCEVSGAQLRQGTRVLLLHASANRDERQWHEPDRFDVMRSGVSGHLAFGRGIHGCTGQNLARMEVHALLTALAAKVQRIETGEPTWRLRNMIRVIASMPVVLHA